MAGSPIDLMNVELSYQAQTELVDLMALLLLIVIGASAGWLASIITRTEAPGLIFRQIGVGLLASLIAGLFANSGTFLGGLSLLALGVSIAAAVIALIAYQLIINRNAGA